MKAGSPHGSEVLAVRAARALGVVKRGDPSYGRIEGVITMMMWDADHWYWGIVMMLIFWGGLLLLVYLVLSRLPRDHRNRTPREILDERFASGDLSREEYEERRAVLEGRSPDDR